MRRVAVVVGCLLGLLPVSGQMVSPGGGMSNFKGLAPDTEFSPVVRSASGAFIVSSGSRRESFEVSRWVEDLAGLIFRHLGMERDVSRSLLYVNLLDRVDEPCRAWMVREPPGSSMPFRVWVVNWPDVPLEDLLDVFCRAVLAAYLEDARTPMDARTLPDWMLQGLAQNLHADLRSRNHERALHLWQSGHMRKLAVYLEQGPAVSVPDTEEQADRRAVRGMVMGWILESPERRSGLTNALRQRPAVSPLDWKELFPDLVSGDVWDHWMVRQKRKIYRPGETSLRDLEWLQGELLLRVAGAEDDAPVQVLPPDQWLAFNGDADFRVWAEERARRLRIQSAGRSEAFMELVDAYALYLDALAGGRSDRELRKRLDEASKKHAALTLHLAPEAGK